jgi:hypothetical protein
MDKDLGAPEPDIHAAVVGLIPKSAVIFITGFPK